MKCGSIYVYYNKGQADALESIILGDGKNILGCFSILIEYACNEAIRVDNLRV